MSIIRNIPELKKVLEGRMGFALKMTQQEVYDVIQKNINDYYKEKVFINYKGNKTAFPRVYERTYQFLNSLLKTDISIKNGVISCSVMIDTESLDYIGHSGDTVVDMINRGYHAEVALNNETTYETPRDIGAEKHFWDDAIQQLGGYDGILSIMKKNCKKVGIPIK